MTSARYKTYDPEPTRRARGISPFVAPPYVCSPPCAYTRSPQQHKHQHYRRADRIASEAPALQQQPRTMMMSVASSSGYHRQLSFGTGFEPSAVTADFKPKASRATLPPSPVTPTDTTPRQALFSTEPLRVPAMAPPPVPSRGRTGRDRTGKTSVSPRKRNSWKRESSEGYPQPRTPRSSMGWGSGPSAHVFYSPHMHSPAMSYPSFAEHQVKREFVPHEYACAPASYLPYTASQPQPYAYSPFEAGVSYGHEAVPFYAASYPPWVSNNEYAAPPPPWSSDNGFSWQHRQPQQDALQPSQRPTAQPASVDADQHISASGRPASSSVDVKMEVIPFEWSPVTSSPAVPAPFEHAGSMPVDGTAFFPFEQISPVPTLEVTPTNATPVPTSAAWSPIRPLTPQSLAASSSSLLPDGFALFDPHSAAQSLACPPSIAVNGPLPQTLEEWVAFVDSLNL